MRGLTLVLLGIGMAALSAAASFTRAEIDQIRRFWIEPGRYAKTDPDNMRRAGKYQVRLTVAGSEWIWNYYRARGYGKVNPSTDPLSIKDAMDQWLEQRVAYDRYIAACNANKKNALELGIPIPETGEAPFDPGPPNQELVDLAGEPPNFAEAVCPKQHRIAFPSGITLTYQDNVDMRPKYAYYRFSQGVRSSGRAVKDMPETELAQLFADAKVNQSVMRVMRAVSILEGGFDSLNTYDTGFLSVGVIQFATLKEGAGSLGAVLSRLKKDNPKAFQTAFRQYGIDVAANNALISLDLVTGDELVGPAAVQNIIDDKRLAAVFQHAGQTCREFCIAQIQVARDRYYPADDVVAVTDPTGKKLSAKVYEIVRSEAGMATLMDRKVNTGKIDPFPRVLSDLMVAYSLKDPREAALYEAELVARVKYRKDYLADPQLSQPKPAPAGSRGKSSRTGRGGSKKK